MANVRITCPTCHAELEIEEEHVGREVECGSCLQAFVAEDGTSKKKPYRMRRPKDDDRDDDDVRPRRRRRSRRREYDDDYDYRPSSASSGGSGLAVLSLILGILSLPMACCCGLFSLPCTLGATITGSIALKNPDGKGMAVTGMVLGIIGLVLSVVMVAIGVGMNLNNPGQFKHLR
jgi:predicted Zn finger-like uncharacterized protein